MEFLLTSSMPQNFNPTLSSPTKSAHPGRKILRRAHETDPYSSVRARGSWSRSGLQGVRSSHAGPPQIGYITTLSSRIKPRLGCDKFCQYLGTISRMAIGDWTWINVTKVNDQLSPTMLAHRRFTPRVSLL